jgi:hypothetical protein
VSAINLAFEAMPDLHLMITCQDVNNPTEAEWDAYLLGLKSLMALQHPFRILVVTEGGHPSRKQQQAGIATTEAVRMKIAIVSPAPGLRFVVAMIALINPDTKCFLPSQRSAAFSHIKLAPGDVSRVLAIIARLQQTLTRTDARVA